MRVRYIKCMDFVFDDVELPEYDDIQKLNKAIENCKVIKVVSIDGDIDYVNSSYIMYVGVYDEINKRS